MSLRIYLGEDGTCDLAADDGDPEVDLRAAKAR